MSSVWVYFLWFTCDFTLTHKETYLPQHCYGERYRCPSFLSHKIYPFACQLLSHLEVPKMFENIEKLKTAQKLYTFFDIFHGNLPCHQDGV